MYGLWAWGVGLHSVHSLPSAKVVKELYHVWFTAVCYPSFWFCGDFVVWKKSLFVKSYIDMHWSLCPRFSMDFFLFQLLGFLFAESWQNLWMSRIFPVIRVISRLHGLTIHTFNLWMFIDFWSLLGVWPHLEVSWVLIFRLFQGFLGVQAQKNTTFAPDFKCLLNSFVSTIK